MAVAGQGGHADEVHAERSHMGAIQIEIRPGAQKRSRGPSHLFEQMLRRG
jgi:hypothetical protein